jgi:hypothetical protein
MTNPTKKEIIEIAFVVHEGKRLLCQKVVVTKHLPDGAKWFDHYWEVVPTLQNVNVKDLPTK